MPIHVPFNGGITVFPYFSVVNLRSPITAESPPVLTSLLRWELKLRSDLPSKLLTPGSHLTPTLWGVPSDLLSPSKSLLDFCCVLHLYVLSYYKMLILQMSRGFSYF